MLHRVWQAARLSLLGSALIIGHAAAQTPAADAKPPESPAAQVPVPALPQPAPGAPPSVPQPPPAAQPSPPLASEQRGTPATVLDVVDSDGIIGKSIRSTAGEDMGRIVDVIVSGNSRVEAVVIDFGGFLGVGSRKIAVDWRALHFATDGKPGRITLALSRNQVRVSPEYKAGEPIVVLGVTSTVPAEAAAAQTAIPPQPAPAAQPAANSGPQPATGQTAPAPPSSTAQPAPAPAQPNP
jgi:hypothetical protein